MQTWLGELIIRQQVHLLDARPFAQSQPKMRALGGGRRNGGLTDEDGHAPDFVTVYTHGCGNSWLGCHETVAVQDLCVAVHHTITKVTFERYSSNPLPQHR